MPPRWMTLAIVGLWLLAMGWMTVREIAPLWRLGEPPPYAIDLTDEVSRQDIHWNITQKGAPVGKARSSVHRLADRTFELRSELNCTKNIVLFKSLYLKSAYQVNGQGELLGFTVSVEAELPPPLESTLKGDLVGKVENGYLTPELRGRFLGHEQVFHGEKSKVPGSILNSMHLLNKISGLREGQRWSMPLIDPLRFFSLGAPARTIPRLDAEVSADSLVWNGQHVACLLIEYREPEKNKVTAQIWVRRSDGVVLKHAARHEVMELVLERDPTK